MRFLKVERREKRVFSDGHDKRQIGGEEEVTKDRSRWVGSSGPRYRGGGPSEGTRGATQSLVDGKVTWTPEEVSPEPTTVHQRR